MVQKYIFIVLVVLGHGFVGAPRGFFRDFRENRGVTYVDAPSASTVICGALYQDPSSLIIKVHPDGLLSSYLFNYARVLLRKIDIEKLNIFVLKEQIDGGFKVIRYSFDRERADSIWKIVTSVNELEQSENSKLAGAMAEILGCLPGGWEKAFRDLDEFDSNKSDPRWPALNAVCWDAVVCERMESLKNDLCSLSDFFVSEAMLAPSILGRYPDEREESAIKAVLEIIKSESAVLVER